MKKFLSLVLALVMTMSLVTISAGAKDFTDDSKITYEEAVDVISALKVVDGYTDGSFNPTATLTRGAAAKIICNLILGPTTASALSADAAPFKDVPANSTFAGYIAFCVKEGIISGYADGTFKPGNTLTGYAFMKMLLGALGYDKSVEGYDGANWSINVAKRALAIGLDKGLTDDFNGIKPVTREEAALYAFNTLTATMVEYKNKSSIVVGDITVTTSAEATKVTHSDASGYKTPAAANDGYTQFCEEYFTKLELRTAANTDSFGRPANTWYNKSTKIGVYAKTPDLTYNKDVEAQDLYKDLDLSNPYDYAVVVDGVSDTRFPIVKRDDQPPYGGAKADDKLGDVISGTVGNGSVIEVFEEDEKIVVKNYYLAQVSGDYDEDDETLTLIDGDASVASISGPVTLRSDDFAGLDAYKDEDYVVVTIASGAIKSIAPAEKVTGAVTNFEDDSFVAIGGTEYKYAETYNGGDGRNDYAIKDEYDLYMAPNGYVLWADGVEAEGNYVYISGAGYASNLSSKAPALADAYFLDGTSKVITVNKLGSNKLEGRVEAALVTEGWYKFTEKNDKYTLNTIAEADLSATSVGASNVTDKDTVNIDVDGNGTGDIKGTKSTIFVVIDKDGDAKVYTGIKNVPEIATPDSVYVVRTGAGTGYAKLVAIDLGTTGTTKGGANSGDVIFVYDDSDRGTDKDENVYYTYKTVKNGTIGKSKFDDQYDGTVRLGTVPTLFVEVEYDENGYVTEATEITGGSYAFGADDDYSVETGLSSADLKGDVLTVDSGNGYYMADNCKVYLLDSSESTIKLSTAKKVAAGTVSAIWGIMDANGEYTTLFVAD